MVVSAAYVSALSDALMEQGAFAVDVADAEAGTERENFLFAEPGQDSEAAFCTNRLVALFSPLPDVSAVVDFALAAAGLRHACNYRVTEVPEQDWVRATQSQFAPIQVSSRLWIVPSWHVAPDPSAINIVLDPGLAFGTGAHPTTRLCLEWLDDNMSPGLSVLDYGCGSGILTIAAAKLGAGRARGVDIDEGALQSSRFNAKRNDVAAEFSSVEEAPLEPAHLVVANILSNPLKVLAPLLAGLTVLGGKLALSGLLSSQVKEVSAAYLPWFALESPVEHEGWARLSGIRER